MLNIENFSVLRWFNVSSRSSASNSDLGMKSGPLGWLQAVSILVVSLMQILGERRLTEGVVVP